MFIINYNVNDTAWCMIWVPMWFQVSGKFPGVVKPASRIFLWRNCLSVIDFCLFLVLPIQSDNHALQLQVIRQMKPGRNSGSTNFRVWYILTSVFAVFLCGFYNTAQQFCPHLDLFNRIIKLLEKTNKHFWNPFTKMIGRKKA